VLKFEHEGKKPSNNYDIQENHNTRTFPNSEPEGPTKQNVTFLLCAVTKTAVGCLWQFINVKVPTVPDLDVNTPMTAFAQPMETNLPCHSALFH